MADIQKRHTRKCAADGDEKKKRRWVCLADERDAACCPVIPSLLGPSVTMEQLHHRL